MINIIKVSIIQIQYGYKKNAQKKPWIREERQNFTFHGPAHPKETS